MVFAPAAMGEIGIAPRHAPLLTDAASRVKCACNAGRRRAVLLRRRRRDRSPAASRHGAGRHGAARQGHRRGRGAAGQAARRRSVARIAATRSMSPKRRPNWPRPWRRSRRSRSCGSSNSRSGFGPTGGSSRSFVQGLYRLINIQIRNGRTSPTLTESSASRAEVALRGPANSSANSPRLWARATACTRVDIEFHENVLDARLDRSLVMPSARATLLFE